MEIVDFIKARLAEETAVAEAAISDQWAWWRVGRHESRHLYVEAGPEATDDGAVMGTLDRAEQSVHAAAQGPAQTLIRAQALAALVGMLTEIFDAHSSFSALEEDRSWVREETASSVLAHVAAIWSWHPDYQEEWKP